MAIQTWLLPDMARGVTLETKYGELTLIGRDAERVAALVRQLLQARLRAAERHGAND